jgi:hypothetical protein
MTLNGRLFYRLLGKAGEFRYSSSDKDWEKVSSSIPMYCLFQHSKSCFETGMP